MSKLGYREEAVLQVKDHSVKTVYADLLGRVGYRVRQLMEYPPTGYHFLSREQWPDQMADWLIRNDSFWKLRHLLNRLVPLNLLASYGPLRFKQPPWGTDLTYSESPLIFRNEPWVVGVEVAIQFAGYDHHHLHRYQKMVESALSSSHCRAIVCWSAAARESLRRAVSTENFEQKLHVVYPAGTRKGLKKTWAFKGAPTRILFVSSVVTPGGFDIKGGRDALAAFAALRQRYPQLELILRCDLDANRQKQYQRIPGLRLVPGLVAREELEQLYQQADIFWYPAHSLTSVVVLEAMSYGLPVVTTDYYDNAEIIENGRTGLVVRQRGDVPQWDTSPGEVRRALVQANPDFVARLVEKTALLLENPELRERLGRAAREEIETGRFSLEQKNQRLKAIFDAAIHNRSH